MSIGLRIIIIYLAVTNIIVFSMFFVDKNKAQKRQWRIPEKTLLLIAALGGSLGAWAGMNLFRHKTQHKKFTILVPLIILVHAVLLLLLVRAIG